MYRKWGKRLFDIVSSVIGLVILSPVLLLTTLMVYLLMGHPVIFIQERPGKDGKIFKLYKFRTMNQVMNSNGILKSDDSRLTKFGLFLRKTSIDELPELWNILKGDMSVVGPRPLLVEYLPLYSQEQKQRHNVRPGLTGLAQINGRNAITWNEKFKYDIEYVKNISFWKDIKILVITFIKVFKSEGVTSDTSFTAEKFRGNANE